MKVWLQNDRAWRPTTLVLLVLWTVVPSVAASEPVDGFLAPYSSVDVATAETGVLRPLSVREGDWVEKGQELLRLDAEVHAAMLAVAAKATEAEGRLQAARVECQVREQRLTKLRELLERGSTRQEEVERAQADAEIARSQLLGIEEELAIKRLEHERARTQWDRRTVRAPLRGAVVKIHKEVGEFVGPSDPQLITIMQLDPLLAVFAVPSSSARGLTVGDEAEVRIHSSQETVTGIIEFISPVIDGKSGTMRVEIQLQNSDRKHLSGDPCSFLLPTEPTDEPDVPALTTTAGE